MFFFTNHLQICERRPDFVARVQRLIVSMLTDEDVPVRMQAQVNIGYYPNTNRMTGY